MSDVSMIMMPSFTPTTARIWSVVPGLLLGILMLLIWQSRVSAQADEPDSHARFEALCGQCHGHSGPFARDRLEIVDGRLVGRSSGRPVEAFLRRHPGGLSSADIRLFYDAMYRQVQSGGIFAERCAICHGRAVELAATNLIVTDGVLLMRYSGMPVRDILRVHGRLRPEEIEFVYQALFESAEGL